MAKWHFSDNGEQVGPISKTEARDYVANHPDAMGWRSGFADWLPVKDITEFSPNASSPPPVKNMTIGQSDEVDYAIKGHEIQFVEVELDPGESAISEAGSMMYKAPDIKMEAIFGDGTGQDGGFMGKMMSAGKRVLTGESLFSTVFTHEGRGKAHVAFAAPYPGTILPINLSEHNGKIICQKDSFLAAARGVTIGIEFQKKILTGLFGGEGFILQKLEGDGMAFLHIGGTLIEKELKAGETLHVDTGCIGALSDTVSYDVKSVGSVKSMLFAGEGVFFAEITGPGKVWLQSLPFSRLAGRMLQAAPQGGGKDRGQGSLLGGIGDLMGGDRGF